MCPGTGVRRSKRGYMVTVEAILKRAALKYEHYEQAGQLPVYLSRGLQLFGGYKTLGQFRSSDKHYHGWQAHHVFETQDLGRMHISQLAPGVDDQLCVLLPERAHIGRINSVLRRQAPLGCVMSPRDLLRAYEDAYELVDDYCGSGALTVKRELVAVVQATLKCYGLM